jgi:hypothetical protein
MSLSAFQPYLERLKQIPPRTAFITAAAVAGLTHAVRSYRAWLALGKGGLPYNVFGWLMQVAAKLLRARTDVTRLGLYSRPDVRAAYDEPYVNLSFLGGDKSLPARRGARPEIPNFVAPQRQSSETADAAMLERMQRFLKAVVRDNPSSLRVASSRLEGGTTDAVWLAKETPMPQFTETTLGEIAHTHPVDGSSHVTLSPGDAEEVIGKGWGQRHGLSGVMLPWTYIFVYAPRDREEWEVWKEIVLASCAFHLSNVAGERKEVSCPSKEALW